MSLRISFLILALSLTGTTFSAQAELLNFGVLGDSGFTNESMLTTQASMKEAGSKRLILAGDNIYDYSLSYSDVWDSWKNLGFQFDLVALGNHNKGYAAEMSYFGLKREYYSKVISGVRFIVLNSDNPKTVAEQKQWLKKELKLAQEEMIFVIYHHPPFTLTKRHSWWEKAWFHWATRPVLDRYQQKITGLIVGHDHVASLVAMDTIPVIVAGAAGDQGEAKPFKHCGLRFKSKTLWLYDQSPTWVQLLIDTHLKTAEVQFRKSSDNSIRCSAQLYPRPDPSTAAKLGQNCR